MLKKVTNSEQKNGKLICLCGVPASGKSSLILTEILDNYKNACYVSLEMSYDVLVERHGETSIKQLDVFIGTTTTEEIDALAKDYTVIVIDHIQLMTGSKSKISKELKQIAMNNEINIYILSQLNRNNELYGSSTILQDSDQVFFIMKDKCLLYKNRFGINMKTFSIIHNPQNFFDMYLWDEMSDKRFSILYEHQDKNLIKDINENDIIGAPAWLREHFQQPQNQKIKGNKPIVGAMVKL